MKTNNDMLHGGKLKPELRQEVPDLPFEKAVLWLDRADGIPRRLEITEHSGATRTLTLSKVRVNR